jgi:hypothetical protein
MSRSFLFLTCGLLLATALSAQAPGQSAPAPSVPLAEEVRRLQAEVAALAAELAVLRERLPPNDGERLAGAEERLARLESAVADVVAELTKVSEAQSAGDQAMAEMHAGEERAIHLTSYGAFVVEDTSRSDSTFDAESFELVFSAQPHPRLGLFAEIELERAASVGGDRGGEVLLEQAWVSLRLTDWLSLRSGALLVPFGNVNVDHYAPNRDVISKPLVSFAVAPSDWTDNGIGLTGTVLLGGEWSMRYETAVVAGLDADITGLGSRAARQPFGADNNHDKAVVGRVGLRRGSRFEVGASGYSGKFDDAGRQRLTGWALDGQLRLGPVALTGEFDRLVADQLSSPDTNLEGWYARASWDLLAGLLRKGAHGSQFPTARLTLVGQYDQIDLEGPIEAVRERNRERRWTLGLNYRPSHAWVLKLDHEWRRAEGRTLVHGEEDAFLASIGFVF